MSHGACAAAISEAMRAIIMAKPLDTLTGRPNMVNDDQLEEQMEKFCASVYTTAWGSRHGCLALALNDNALYKSTKDTVTNSALRKPVKINKSIKEDTSDWTNFP